MSLTFTLPVIAIARDAAEEPKTGMTQYSGFHCRVCDFEGKSANCLMLFNSPNSVQAYVAGRPTLSSAHAVVIKDKLELETILAELRQAGTKLVMLGAGEAGSSIVRADDLAKALDAME